MSEIYWDGKAALKVGEICEIYPAGAGWRKGKISYMGNGFIAWYQIGDDEVPEMGSFMETTRFRLIMTPDQRREKAIREMGVIVLSTDPFTVMEGVAALYDAGYRKI